MEQFRERSVVANEKGAFGLLSTMVANFALLWMFLVFFSPRYQFLFTNCIICFFFHTARAIEIGIKMKYIYNSVG